MPGLMKKVRFSPMKTLLSPPTLAPPPLMYSHSGSSASSAGPITPPQYVNQLPGPMPYNPTDFTLAPYPQPRYRHTSSSRSAQLHRYLDASGGHPPIHYNLLDPPTSASRHQRSLPHHSLSEPATNPPLSSLTIKSENLPWHLRIVPSSSRVAYVTVQDVIDQLYGTLRSNIGQSDYDRMGSAERKMAIRAYEDRYRRFRERREYEYEKAGGMKRIDMLMSRTRFIGLSRTKEPGVFVLNTG
ncbi:hypothetical protein BKA70DRAFT_1279764 [Coprinopsis sp. MPI-PUGE-AT-0042]|nr:hypothetical protein BKA70DRAFT_1279764 [Coprinopsis sp. MPI-PUGE-AT-0042]